MDKDFKRNNKIKDTVIRNAICFDKESGVYDEVDVVEKPCLCGQVT